MIDAEKLALIWDERAIERVMLRFGRALDTGDWPAYRSCFTDEVNIDFKRLTNHCEVRVNADDWTVFASQVLGPVRRHHVYSNFNISIAGDTAFAIVYMTARHWRATDLGTSDYTQYGWYDAWFERHADGWKIARLKHDFQWVEGNNALFDMTEPGLATTMQKIFCAETADHAARHLASPGFIGTEQRA